MEQIIHHVEFYDINAYKQRQHFVGIFRNFGALISFQRLGLNNGSADTGGQFVPVQAGSAHVFQGAVSVLVKFLADNIGNLFSASNISKYLKSQRTTVSTQTVLNYLNPLLNAFFIHKVSRLDINGLKIFEIGDKYYFEDLGLRNVIRGCDLNKDIQKLLENAVYLHLLCSGYDVKVGQQGNYEIDFVGIKNGSRIYIQVAYLILDEKTREREFGNLMNIPDHYPKYVISMDEFNAGTNDKGIKQLHVRDFLKMEI